MAFYKGHEDSTVAFSKDEVELLREAIQTQQFKLVDRMVDLPDTKELNFASATSVSEYKLKMTNQFKMLQSAVDKIDATHPTLKEKR